MSLQNRGLVKTAQGKAAIRKIPIPRLRDEYVLVKTIAVALSPTDWQTLDEKPGEEFTYSVLGVDAAGVVVEVGSKVTKKFKKGDRVLGLSHGGNEHESEDGTFAEYIVMKGDIAIHIPDHLSFEQAASMGTGILSVGLGFYRYLELPFPSLPAESNKDGCWIFIYAGSTATGALAIQFAKLSGLKVITTASPRNFKLLKELGADHVIDYHDLDCSAKINALTNNELTLVFDTISNDSSAKIAAAALSTIVSPPLSKKIYVDIMGTITFPRKDVVHSFMLAYTIRGEAFEIEGERWEAEPEDFQLGKKIANLADKLLEDGLLKNHPIRLLDGGLESILGGMEDLKQGRVSGEKLVASIQEP